MVAKTLPRRVEDLDIIIVRRHNTKGKYYDCYVNRSQVFNASRFKIERDKYYSDVEIEFESIALVPERTTNVSGKLKFVDSNIQE